MDAEHTDKSFKNVQLRPNQAKAIIQAQQSQIQAQQSQIRALQVEFDDLRQLIDQLKQGRSATQRLDESFSMAAERKRHQAGSRRKDRRERHKRLERGRLQTADNIVLACRTE